MKNVFYILVWDFQPKFIFRWARCRFQNHSTLLHILDWYGLYWSTSYRKKKSRGFTVVEWCNLDCQRVSSLNCFKNMFSSILIWFIIIKISNIIKFLIVKTNFIAFLVVVHWMSEPPSLKDFLVEKWITSIRKKLTASSNLLIVDGRKVNK